MKDADPWIPPLPEVDAQGRVLSLRDEMEAWAAGNPLPARLLLRYGENTRRDQLTSAFVRATGYGFVALLPSAVLAAWVKSFTYAGRGGPIAFFVSLLAVCVWGFVKDFTTSGLTSRWASWLDFETRSWRSRESYLDSRRPDKTAEVPLDELALVCYFEGPDNPKPHEVAVYKLADFKKAKRLGDLQWLIFVHQSSEEADAFAFAKCLAGLWGIECWEWIGGYTSEIRRLA
ncbi:hypothetical protein WKW79_14360 [Variovorax robiniae]|uniref:SMODS and SLOG-associating 2TM effector domain-containing protein n=1 Tax=Variovorax robiniae TaxID=1836199 RepID=A0ABU8X7K8_9BURK